ncbi:MAG: M23 family metallopeptidase [Chthoniobacterales bacterium]
MFLIFSLFRSLILALILLFFFAPLQADTLGKTIHLANGFDFPTTPPDADGFYKSRGFRTGGHLGEDWVNDNGSGSSLGLPVHSIGSGFVMLARDVHVAWGNVIIIRHAYLEEGKVTFIDSLYAHLDRIHVKEGDNVARGQQIGTIGNNHGMYPAHLHFEVHKNLNIGVNHTSFAKTLINYWIPTDFIVKRRVLSGSSRTALLPITHFDIPSPESFHSHSSKKKRKTHSSSSQNSSRNRRV